MEQIKIMLAEDHTLVREAFASAIDSETDFEVIGHASNGRELLDLIKINEPQLVLLDIDMPVMNGKQALEIIKKRFPHIKVIMLSLHQEPGLMNEYMANGANGYLNKNVEIETLFEAIRVVHRDGTYFNKELSMALLAGVRSGKDSPAFYTEQSLTSKELVVLKEICEGKTNKHIADDLHISVNTVDFHRSNIYTKTKCHNIASLVKYAIKHELIRV